MASVRAALVIVVFVFVVVVGGHVRGGGTRRGGGAGVVVVGVAFEACDGLADASAADEGVVDEGALPVEFVAAFEAHGAGGALGGDVFEWAFGSRDAHAHVDDGGVGGVEAVFADEAALVAFDHGAVFAPGLVAEVALEVVVAGGGGVVHGEGTVRGGWVARGLLGLLADAEGGEDEAEGFVAFDAACERGEGVEGGAECVGDEFGVIGGGVVCELFVEGGECLSAGGEGGVVAWEEVEG